MRQHPSGRGQMITGLRVDVDTFRGTRDGVPGLLKTLDRYAVKASFFFSVGPDNMGRHIWRLLRPAFLKKMLRSKAASLYGWDILLKGTLWPGPVIGEKQGHIIKEAAARGHEIGLHAWDHHAWQSLLDRMNPSAIGTELKRGVNRLTELLGTPPTCSAAPSWKCNDAVLVQKQGFLFQYNSDCRGKSIFYPVVDGNPLSQPQVPTTLPTYDEVIGEKGVSAANYNKYILSLIKPQRLNVLTVHAEVEGISCRAMFDDFLRSAASKGVGFQPLGTLVGNASEIERGVIVAGKVEGRDGWVACQAPEMAAKQGT